MKTHKSITVCFIGLTNSDKGKMIVSHGGNLTYCWTCIFKRFFYFIFFQYNDWVILRRDIPFTMVALTSLVWIFWPFELWRLMRRIASVASGVSPHILFWVTTPCKGTTETEAMCPGWDLNFEFKVNVCTSGAAEAQNTAVTIVFGCPIRWVACGLLLVKVGICIVIFSASHTSSCHLALFQVIVLKMFPACAGTSSERAPRGRWCTRERTTKSRALESASRTGLRMRWGAKPFLFLFCCAAELDAFGPCVVSLPWIPF